MILAAAATMIVSSDAAAQEQCYGPHASYDTAVDQCIYLLNIGHCLPQPVGHATIRQDDFGYSYCCCVALIAAQPDEDQAMLEDEAVSEEQQEIDELASGERVPIEADNQLWSAAAAQGSGEPVH
jgi:hypothetical protein